MKLQVHFHSLWMLSLFVCLIFSVAKLSTSSAQEPIDKEMQIESLAFVPEPPSLASMGFYSLPERITVKGVNLPKITGGFFFWSAENGRLWHSIPFSKDVRPKLFDLSPDGARVVSVFVDYGSEDKRLERHGLGCYSIAEKKWLWKWKWSQGEIDGAPLTVRFLPDGHRVLVLGLWSVWYYDAETGQKLKDWKGLLKDYTLWKYAVRTSYVSPSCRLLVIWQERPWEGIALGGVNKYVTVWDLETGKEVARWEKPKYECQIATFSPDEQSVVFGCKDGHVREWSIKTRSLTRELRISAGVHSVAFSPDGRFLSVNAGIRDITVFDYSKQKEIHQFDSPGKNYSLTAGEQYPMAFSPDGELFALWDKGKICLYSTSNWEQKWCVVPRPPDLPKDN